MVCSSSSRSSSSSSMLCSSSSSRSRSCSSSSSSGSRRSSMVRSSSSSSSSSSSGYCISFVGNFLRVLLTCSHAAISLSNSSLSISTPTSRLPGKLPGGVLRERDRRTMGARKAANFSLDMVRRSDQSKSSRYWDDNFPAFLLSATAISSLLALTTSVHAS
eukprot:gb/GEZN01014360.1/.p2 GENE.gb/GEZN01014360.1/~~gb/GEZN01014360.1/.p2  ORF type:complete len:161 (+),score=45.72 gb/GEZN01014360.1/:151-633(+)